MLPLRLAACPAPLAPRAATALQALRIAAPAPEKKVGKKYENVDSTFLKCWLNIFKMLVQYFFSKMLNEPSAKSW
jgi:hypothetical protein